MLTEKLVVFSFASFCDVPAFKYFTFVLRSKHVSFKQDPTQSLPSFWVSIPKWNPSWFLRQPNE